MALAFCRREQKIPILLFGFAITAGLHGLYNFSIIKSEDDVSYLLIPLAIITLLAITLYLQFQRLLKMKSVCKA
jgi:RsiW-degrading membrane proteinase PrsW (M82 family)